MKESDISAGYFTPLGATLTKGGANFAIYSKYATRVDLCLYTSGDADRPYRTVELPSKTRNVWHGFVHELELGTLYGFKVDGPFDPSRGFRFNRNKLLLDPYAKSITGHFDPLSNQSYSYNFDDPEEGNSFDDTPNDAIIPKSVVVESPIGGTGPKLDIPLSDLVIYEVHLKNFSAHPSSGTNYPGTFTGFVEKIPYLKSLGINAVELLPIQYCLQDRILAERGLKNFWGYNTIAYFVIDPRFSSSDVPGYEIFEFRRMVSSLHYAGIEVILDVVFNHSGEGSHLGPTVCFRGIDNPTYYQLNPSDKSKYIDFTGCGNSLNLANPQVMKFVADCLRYWVAVMGVDGFRFDLATTLGRTGGTFNPLASFFSILHQDPILSQVKLIAEPWDIGQDSYQVGNFPVDFAEWNGKFRDAVRRFVKGDFGQIADMGWRLTGSQDLFGDDDRTPDHSINFITCHDGFTLHDLVSYEKKHNEANKEENTDGTDVNFSRNWGTEGDTEDKNILGMRARITRNMFTVLLLSQGTPMIQAGDEFWRTQKGNNNAYCQDNEISWFDWGLLEKYRDLWNFVSGLIKLRQRHKALRRRNFFEGRDRDGNRVADIIWYSQNLSPLNFNDYSNRSIAFHLSGVEVQQPDGAPEDDFYIIYHFSDDPMSFMLPNPTRNGQWKKIVDSSMLAGSDFVLEEVAPVLQDQNKILVEPFTSIVLIAKPADATK